MTFLTLNTIARAMDGKVVGQAVRCAGPGHSKADDSLVISLASTEDGFAVHSHAGDDFRECKDYVRDRLGLEEFGGGRRAIDPAEEERRARERQLADERQNRLYAEKLATSKSIWEGARRLRGSLAERYLVQRLANIAVPEAVFEGGALRFTGLNQLPPFFRETGEGAVGAMVALMTDAETNKSTGLHLTFITADGRNLKEERKGKRVSVRRMYGQQGVVRLWHDAEVETSVSICEGIESGLSGKLLREGPPVWAALDAGGVASFPVLSGIEHLKIFTDNDKSETGLRTAGECKARWEEAGRFVVIEMPPDTGQDFNDFLNDLKTMAAA